MFCPECSNYLDEKDFMPNQTICYKCMYKRKVGEGIELRKIKRCKICDVILTNSKKFSYCSEDCARKGDLIVRRLRWAQ